MFLVKFPLAANGLAMSMKKKVMIQSALVIVHTVHVSDSPDAWMNIRGMNFFGRFGEVEILRNPMPILTVFPGKSVKLSTYLDKPFPNYLQADSVDLSQHI